MKQWWEDNKPHMWVLVPIGIFVAWVLLALMSFIDPTGALLK